jgi:hypothetical protein
MILHASQQSSTKNSKLENEITNYDVLQMGKIENQHLEENMFGLQE